MDGIGEQLSNFEREYGIQIYPLFFWATLAAIAMSTTSFRRTKPARLFCFALLWIGLIIEMITRTFELIPLEAQDMHMFSFRLIFIGCISSSIVLSVVFNSDSQSPQRKPTVQPFMKTDSDYNLRVFHGTDALQIKPVRNPHIVRLREIATAEGLPIESADFAAHMDSIDPLSRFQAKFLFPQITSIKPLLSSKSSQRNKVVYMCGNSLGLQPSTTQKAVMEELDRWKSCAVDAHFEGTRPWFMIEQAAVRKMASIVGANPIEVAICNSLTVNLHIMMTAFYLPTPKRHKILIEENPFPSDMYAVISQIRLHGYDPSESLIQVGVRPGQTNAVTQDIIELIEREGDSISLILMSGVHFLTGQAFDIGRITRTAHSCGIVVGFDLAHASGNLDLSLHDWDVDFAFWCTYKYLNCGPGNIGCLFVHERFAHNNTLRRLAGWWGNRPESRFALKSRFDLSPGAAGFQLSNQLVLGIACIDASLDIFEEAGGMAPLRRKSMLLTSYLELLIDKELDGRVQMLTPRDPQQRGSQISLRIPNDNAQEIQHGLHEFGVVCDKREPDILRFAPVPLYNSFSDVHTCVMALKRMLQ